MTAYLQTGRTLSVSTALGDDVLLLSSFTGREEMSRLFQYDLELLSTDDAVNPEAVVGKPITFGVMPSEGDPRYFNGIVSRFSAGQRGNRGLRSYRAEVVPWLWFLTQNADCRIFQHQTAPDIVKKIFDELGFTDYQFNLRGDYAQRDYCVQYRESSFKFVSRLLEEEGIAYHFRHENGTHTLVLSDHQAEYKSCEETNVRFGAAGSAEEALISGWEHRYEFRPAKYTQNDYNFETPSLGLMNSTDTVMKLPGANKLEVYDYPGRFAKRGQGAALTKLRMEEHEMKHDVVQGAGNCRTFSSGCKFVLAEHECPAEAGKGYLITSIQHSAQDHSYQNDEEEGVEYNNTFTCIPEGVTFRPERATGRPRVDGTQTAVVVGPKGEEIYTDKNGRIKVQFHWDREGQRDEKSSCWVRVATPWAGRGWGMVQIPRIGQEVIVDFLEGDPDRPLVIGSVYNAEQMPPGKLPEDKMVSGMVSNSTPGGGGYNGIQFNDTKGKEQMNIHAQFDQNVTVENDQNTTIHNNRNATVDVNSEELVGGTKKTTVNGSVLETYNSALSTVVKSGVMLASTGANIDIVAATQLMLNSGASTITLKADGTIEITGVNIKINGKSLIEQCAPNIGIYGGSEVLMGVDAQAVKCDGGAVTVSGAEINASAEGTHNIKGALVKIN
jgi:type VI secretion system secreted protein VgrG